MVIGTKRKENQSLIEHMRKKAVRLFTLQGVQQITNSGAVVSHDSIVNCDLTMTFQGVEYKLHYIYIWGYPAVLPPMQPRFSVAKRKSSVMAGECIPAENRVSN